MIEIAPTKDDLPKDTDLQCPICLDDINLDELKNGMPNCVICDNGHRCHNTCFTQSNIHQCPVCKNQHMRFCKSQFGYAYSPRKGGKVNKSKKNKPYKKRKTYKRRKTYKNK